MIRRLATIILLTCLLGVSGSASFVAADTGPQVKAPQVVCNFFYRARTFSNAENDQIPQETRQVVVDVPQNVEDATEKPKRFLMQEFVVDVSTSAGHLIVRFSDPKTKRPISASRFRIKPNMSNQFQSQGFTGLIYVKHPTSDAELQFWALVK